MTDSETSPSRGTPPRGATTELYPRDHSTAEVLRAWRARAEAAMRAEGYPWTHTLGERPLTDHNDRLPTDPAPALPLDEPPDFELPTGIHEPPGELQEVDLSSMDERALLLHAISMIEHGNRRIDAVNERLTAIEQANKDTANGGLSNHQDVQRVRSDVDRINREGCNRFQGECLAGGS